MRLSVTSGCPNHESVLVFQFRCVSFIVVPNKNIVTDLSKFGVYDTLFPTPEKASGRAWSICACVRACVCMCHTWVCGACSSRAWLYHKQQDMLQPIFIVVVFFHGLVVQRWTFPPTSTFLPNLLLRYFVFFDRSDVLLL